MPSPATLSRRSCTSTSTERTARWTTTSCSPSPSPRRRTGLTVARWDRVLLKIFSQKFYFQPIPSSSVSIQIQLYLWYNYIKSESLMLNFMGNIGQITNIYINRLDWRLGLIFSSDKLSAFASEFLGIFLGCSYSTSHTTSI